MRLQQRPNESVVLLTFAIMNTECLAFLTSDENARRTFRKLDVLRVLLEDFPLAIIMLAFLYEHGYHGHLLISISFGWSVGTIVLKLLRVLIISVTGTMEREATVPFFKNVRLEDYLLFPFYLLHWILLLCLLFFFDYAAFWPRFSHDWLTQQLLALGGFNATDALNATLSAATLADANATATLLSLAATKANSTYVDGWMRVVPKASCADGTSCPLDIPTLVSRVILPNGTADAGAIALAEQYLSPTAVDLVLEWGELHSRMRWCFGVGVFFFVGGCLSSVVLLVRYITSKKFEESFQTKLMSASSLTSAFVAACSLVYGGFLNALSQDRLGYSIVKRDAALAHLLFYGIPTIGIASAAIWKFSCQSRACGIMFKDSYVEFYTIFCLVITVPMVWWQFLSLLTASIAVRSSTANPDKKDAAEPTQEELDAAEPPVNEAGTFSGVVGTLLVLALSGLKWLFQMLLLLAFFWNSTLATRTIGGRSAREWGDAYAGARVRAAIDLGADMNLDSNFFAVGMFFWILGMLINVVSTGAFMLRSSTPALKKAVEERLALTAFACTYSAIHPEALRMLADRRVDVFALRKLGVLPALLLDIPIVVQCMRFLAQYGWNFFVFVAAISSFAHALIFLARALVVAITGDLRRKPYVPDVNMGDAPFSRMSLGDVATLLVSLFHLFLICCLIGLYNHGWFFGPFMGFPDGAAGACQLAYYAVLIIVFSLIFANLCTAASFLNHWEYSHETISDHSYISAVVFLLCGFDVGWLNLLSTDAIAVREVKRTASMVSIGALFAPSLILQAAVIFMAGVPFSYLDDAADDPRVIEAALLLEGSGDFFEHHFDGLMAGSTTQNAAMAFTVLIGVWKLLLLVVLHTARQQDIKVNPVPYKHTPFVLGDQWMENRKAPDGFDDARIRARRALEARGNGLPTHHMGYAIDATGNYIYDADGQYTLGPGCQYVFDADGNYALDEFGNAMIEDEQGVLIGEGYGNDGYGGYVGGAQGDNETIASNSTNTLQPGSVGLEMGGIGPASMLWATCQQSALFTRPDGVLGVFVRLPPGPGQLPFLFLQAHEQQPLKKSFMKKSAPQTRFSFLSVDVSAYGLDQQYVESHISNDPRTAWRQLQEAEFGLAPAADPYGYDDQQYGGGQQYGQQQYGQQQYGQQPMQSPYDERMARAREQRAGARGAKPTPTQDYSHGYGGDLDANAVASPRAPPGGEEKFSL